MAVRRGYALLTSRGAPDAGREAGLGRRGRARERVTPQVLSGLGATEVESGVGEERPGKGGAGAGASARPGTDAGSPRGPGRRGQDAGAGRPERVAGRTRPGAGSLRTAPSGTRLGVRVQPRPARASWGEERKRERRVTFCWLSRYCEVFISSQIFTVV